MKTGPKPLDEDASDCSVTEKSEEQALIGEASGVVREVEIGGRVGPEPTRFGDWEKGGRCIDF